MVLIANRACSVTINDTIYCLAAGETMRLHDLDPDKLANVFELLNTNVLGVLTDENYESYSFAADFGQYDDAGLYEVVDMGDQLDLFTNIPLRAPKDIP